MDQNDPYLSFLRGTFANLSGVTASDPLLALQSGAAGQLVDYLKAAGAATPALKAEAYAAVRELLPMLEPLLGPQPSLRQSCSAADPAAFEAFQAQLGALQAPLLALGTAQGRTLCAAITALDGAFNRGLARAVDEQAARSARQSGAVARNERSYDPQAVQAFLRSAFPEERELAIASSGFISGGYSKFTVGLNLTGTRNLPREIILRADAAATFGGASVVDEYRLIQTLHEHGVRVPRPLAVENTGKVFGSRFMLVEKRPGGSIGHMYKLPPRSPAVCRDVAQQLAAIHRIPVDAFGTQVDNAAGRSSDKALAWIAEGQKAWLPLAMPSPAFEGAFAWLRANAGLNDAVPRTLVHGDVHLANMLVHEDRISTILDWEFAHIGNPAYDLGYFYDQAVALDSWEAFLEAYAEAGAPVPDQRQLDYAILFAATRLGVMTCQSKHEFASGKSPGLAGAVVIGSLFYETTIMRISRALERVLRA